MPDRAAEGLPYGERAIALASESRLANQLWKAQLTVGAVQLALGKFSEARAQFEAAINTVELLRKNAAGGLRALQLLMTERLGPYYSLASLDIRDGRAFEALASVDRARARALTSLLSSSHAPSDRLSAPDRAEERRLTRAVQAASDALDAEAAKAGAEAGRIAALDAALATARNRREEFLEALYSRQPALKFARGNVPELTPAQLASTLTPGSAIVSFVLDEHRAWGFLIANGPSGPTVRPDPLTLSSDELSALADTFAGQIASRDLAFAPTARKLYDALLAPIESSLTKTTSLVIIPDGPLWRVPFQALRTPRNTFVIEERAVSYTASVAALAALESRRRARPAAAPFLLALGDPAGPASVAGANGEQPQRGLTLARLPEAAREVKSIGQLYGANSRVLTDTLATETALRELASRASVLHIATHGFLENGNPMYSRLQLAPSTDRSADHTGDGRLEAWEVQDLELRADIAVLSACRSAGGTGFGEGVIGLSWSLFAAGASTAVVSQWEVDSASTTSLMIAFHQRLLQRGAPVTAATAMRDAQRTLLKNPQFRHPFYWAGFDVIGAR